MKPLAALTVAGWLCAACGYQTCSTVTINPAIFGLPSQPTGTAQCKTVGHP